LEERLDEPVGLLQQREEQMLAIDRLMRMVFCDALRILQRSLSLGRETIQLHTQQNR
jgi:hypothetical protein